MKLIVQDYVMYTMLCALYYKYSFNYYNIIRL